MFMPILEGLDGVEKMSKSLGNYIGVNEPAQVMFKKVMEVPDSLIIKYFELATDEHPDKVDELKKRLEAGENPRDIKLILADTITKLYHGDSEAQRAKEFYETAFSKRAIPEDIPELHLKDNPTLGSMIPDLVSEGFVQSKSEFTRLLKQSGVQLNGEKIGFGDMDKALSPADVIKIGKKRFVRLV